MKWILGMICGLLLMPQTTQATACKEYYPGAPAVYWVARWNQPSFFFHHGRMQWDGNSWDGELVVGPRVKKGIVRFKFNADSDLSKPPFLDVPFEEIPAQEQSKYRLPGYRFFREDSLTKDPRRSDWWLSEIERDHRSLWGAVEGAACSQEHTFMTQMILDHMECQGVLPRDTHHMSSAAIKAVLQRYTQMVIPEAAPN